MRIFHKLRRIFKKRFRTYLLENKYKVIPAFEYGGVRYYMFDQQTEVPTGRQFAALTIYNEMDMRCSRDYLEQHCRAMEKIISDPKKIHIGYIAQLNMNLKERLGLMAMPEFIYKLASVVFFDDTESPYRYDEKYNEKKIASWKQNPDMLDFFLKTPLYELVPSLNSQAKISKTFLEITEKAAEIHRKHLTAILSEKE